MLVQEGTHIREGADFVSTPALHQLNASVQSCFKAVSLALLLHLHHHSVSFSFAVLLLPF